MWGSTWGNARGGQAKWTSLKPVLFGLGRMYQVALDMHFETLEGKIDDGRQFPIVASATDGWR